MILEVYKDLVDLADLEITVKKWRIVVETTKKVYIEIWRSLRKGIISKNEFNDIDIGRVIQEKINSMSPKKKQTMEQLEYSTDDLINQILELLFCELTADGFNITRDTSCRLIAKMNIESYQMLREMIPSKFDSPIYQAQKKLESMEQVLAECRTELKPSKKQSTKYKRGRKKK